ncbi:DNA repair-scaffolding protein isoform X1 [Gadus chalcogrammus]|uniref:DNA repair-scaffolding protein isoform X1 n=1 Tax=Gadus chalcogrammus TaxID=1042646 RepID=UPI0024C483DA|nr:DNA repair-scaffolding protein isoform X1 [Gadus chalcogrammus]
MPACLKRKKFSRDIRCVVFPDEVGHNSANSAAGLTAPSTGSSAARAWERCGESFIDLPKVKDGHSSGRTLSAVRKLDPASFSVHDSSGHHDDDPVDIAWTSSENEGSGNESPKQSLAKAVPPKRQERKRKIQRPAARASHALPVGEAPSISSHHDDADPLDIAWTSSSESERSDTDHDRSLARAMAPGPPERRRKTLRPTAAVECSDKPPTDEEDLPIIDSDSDLNGSPDQLKRDSAGHISECESPRHAVDGGLKAPISPGPLGDPDASDWATREGGGYSASLNRPDGHGQANKRSLGDWVRAAQAMHMHMHTPRKQADAQSKTPEDSGKKNRKLTSGGFAERLTRLQGRQRSSFSLWRHLSIAEDSAATAVQPGVLVLEVLDVREECSMQLVHCQQRRPPGWETTTPAAAAATPTAARLLVLFDRKTSAQLRPAPGDIIHVYPPWQRLDVEDESTTVILNTHFSQKVYSDVKTTNPQAQPRPWPPLARCVPYSLSNTFGLHGADSVKRKDATTEQVANGEGVVGGPGDMDWAPGHSLLEVIEGLGRPGSVGPEVRVVVQRVYSCYVPERPTASAARPRAPPPPAAPPPRRGRSRLCALVQDGRGIFSVVQLQPLPGDRELQQYTQKWQGRACTLRNVKVVQRVTRERYGRAFHLIDSVWPPTIPFQGRGTSAAPCFYYLLSGQEDSVEALEGSALSALYLPPKELPLRDVLRSAGGVRCHSFTATVVYASILGDAVDQAEVWLSLTDPSLQEEGEGRAEGGGPCGRTVPVCISNSCVLTSSVAAAIRSPTAAILSFRDVVMENGALLCTEQSVVETPHPDRAGRSELNGSEPPTPTRATLGCGLPRPVRLDPLGADTTAHSLCTLTGVIVGVEEDTACSWPACSACGSDRLQATGVGES